MEKKTPRRLNWAMKERAARRMLTGESAMALSRELGVARSKLYLWRDQYRAGGSDLWRRATGRPPGGTRDLSAILRAEEIAAENRLGELERKIGQQQLVIDFLQQALRRVEGGRQQKKLPGVNGSIPTSER